MNEPHQHRERPPQASGFEPQKRTDTGLFFSGFPRGKRDLRIAFPALALQADAVHLIRINMRQDQGDHHCPQLSVSAHLPFNEPCRRKKECQLP